MTGNAGQSVPRADSITHQHIVATVNTLLGPGSRTEPLRILDLGCGDGRLLGHMMRALAFLRPDLRFDLYGLDVWDAGQQDPDYIEATRGYLQGKCPAFAWSERIRLVSSRDEWPFPDENFDFITSNQVMEHVMDHGFVFRNVRRCLRPGGISINLFPVREVLWEVHARMPFVHRVRDEKARAALILLLAKAGFRGTYRREMQKRGWGSLEEFARVYAHVLQTDTNYLTTRQLIVEAQRAGLEISFACTKDFYRSKVLSYFGKRPYRYPDPVFPDTRGLFLFRYISSVTVLLKRVP